MSETYYTGQILETIRYVREITDDNAVVPYGDSVKGRLQGSFNKIRTAIRMLGCWEPQTSDSESFKAFVKAILTADTEGDLHGAVSYLLNPDIDNLFSRLAGEMNPALEVEAEQRKDIYNKYADSIRQISVKSYYSFAATEIFALSVTMPLVFTVSPLLLVPGAALLISALPFASAGMVTFAHEASAVKIPEQGYTKYELLTNSRTQGKKDLKSIQDAHKKASDRLRFAQEWFGGWACVAAAAAFTIMLVILNQ